MSASDVGPADAVLLVAVLILSISLGGALTGLRGGVIRVPAAPPVAIALWGVVAVPTLLQIPFPAFGAALERDPVLIRDGNQWWRILTSAAVQDGGVVVAVTNLAVLALVTSMAGHVWGTGRTLLVFSSAQLIFGLLTAFVFPSQGAGSSGVSLAAAASIAGLAVMLTPSRCESALAAGVIVAGAALVWSADAHGLAILTGVLLGAALGTVSPPILTRRATVSDRV